MVTVWNKEEGQRRGAGEQGWRRERGQQRLHAWTLERPGRAQQGHKRIDQRGGQGMQEGAGGKRGGAQHFQALAKGGDSPAVEPIGNLAGHEDQQRHRQELGKADQAKRKRAMGQGIDLPADRDR
jgi:hypothetical protein